MIVTTAPTGNIGSQLLDRLLAATDDPLRVIARDPGKLPAGVSERAEIIAGSHGDPAVIDRALSGADALFWLTPPPWTAASLTEGMEEFARPAAEAVRRHDVGHVVVISNLGRGMPGDAGVVTHGIAVEDLFAATGTACRGLALPGFIDNFRLNLDAMLTDGTFSWPQTPDLKVPFVATADIVEVATGLLVDRTWSGQETLPLLGPEDLSMREVAAVLSEVLARPIEYVEQPSDEFRAGLMTHGASTAMADGMAAMMTAVNTGLYNHEPRTAAKTTPTSVREWAEKHLRS